jgi:glucose/arabinose dehydrogenase
MLLFAPLKRAAVLSVACLVGCSHGASPSAPAGSRDPFCTLPGSVVWTAQGVTTVPGGVAADLTWLHLPAGFCAHFFATVKMARQLKFAPDGDLFVASPGTATVGGANDGLSSIVVLADDDQDGVADSNLTFLGGLPSTQGMMFAGGYLYYQDDVAIRRVLVRPGDRRAGGPSEVVARITAMQAPEHWPKVLDQAKDGTIYVSNGGSQDEICVSTRAPFGGVYEIEADGSTTEVARGLRNPIAVRCEQDHDVCLAAELGLDNSAHVGGREKIIPIRRGDDWGHPCCATKDVPFAGTLYADTMQAPDCSAVALESDAFTIGDTPFGLDFETGKWPAPWSRSLFVTLHGSGGAWYGARVVAIAVDPSTGLPVSASELGDAGASSGLIEFATGWDDGLQDHGRPASIAFAADGRLFLGDDHLGAVVWIAPVDLK